MSETREWVSQLLQRHARVVAHQAAPAPSALAALNSLQLADAVLNKCRLVQTAPSHALQLVVTGPTQSGKSSLVNLLLDTEAAGVSALAGYTVHAQGFATGCDAQQLQLLAQLLTPSRRVPMSTLDERELDSYSLESISAGQDALVERAVVWDTPDFDSIDAATYRRAVMNTLAMADIVILMVSKDKYGDKSVWDMLQLIHPLDRTLLVCLNKVDAHDAEAVLTAFTTRYSEQFRIPPPPVQLMPFIRRQTLQPERLPEQSPDRAEQTIVLSPEQRQALRHTIDEARRRVDRSTLDQAVETFITLHRDQWLAPLIEEREASSSWTLAVQAAVSDARTLYAQDYLHNPDRYDTFNRALAELLTLLEIPGLAPALIRTRQVVTWPARQLLGLGRAAMRKSFRPASGAKREALPDSQEAGTLQRVLDQSLVALQGFLLDQPALPFWRALTAAFRQHQPTLRASFHERSIAVRQEFDIQIEQAALRLYVQLQAQPALLNTLRAARVSADAAGIALALKSGGLAPTDLVLAPAMLSVTTLLTESALGKYLDSVKADLKDRQLQHIHDRLLQGFLARELIQLASTLPDEHLFAQHLEEELGAVVAQISMRNANTAGRRR